MSKQYKILAINPGSTSTKISIFHGQDEVLTKNIEHDWKTMQRYKLFDQPPYREEEITDFLNDENYDYADIDAVVGRGCDLVKPTSCGVYLVDEEILKDVVIATRGHANSLGAIMAYDFAQKIGVNPYIVHPEGVNESWPLASISGLKGCVKDNHFHVLSHKEVGRRVGELLGTRYEDLNLIIAHLGGGITIAAHLKGRCVDSTSANKSTGPFSGRRAGGIRPWDIMDLCFKDGMTKEKMEDILMKSGGLVSYLGTDDCIKIEERIKNGDKEASLVYEAMAYRISKEIGMYATVLKGDVDGICLTGGMANSKMLVEWIKERTRFIAPVFNFPGSFEMEAMNNAVQDVLKGHANVNKY